MAEAGGIDTSSYRQPQQPGTLDVAAKLQGLQQGAQNIEKTGISIDNDKLNLINKRYEMLLKELTSAGPDATPEKLVEIGQNAVKNKLIRPQDYATFLKQMPVKQEAIPEFMKQTFQRLSETQAAINHHYGVPGMIDNGQSEQPVTISAMNGVKPLGAPIQKQLPPSTVDVGPGGSRMIGAQPSQLPEGAAPAPGGLAGQFVKPPVSPAAAIPGPSKNFGGTVLGAAVDPSFEDRFSPTGIKPRGPMTEQPPGFAEGLKQRTEDQNIATNEMQAIKPAVQALKLMNTEGFRSGPGTAPFNNFVAALKANGIINIKDNDDPTAIYQEVNKKLAQIVSSSSIAGRSDAAQALSEAASPNAKTQILPALKKLTRDVIGLKLVEAARANAFKGNDLQNYGVHRSTFPQSMDERAFTLNLMEDKERDALVKDMAGKLKSGKNSEKAAGKKFFDSLRVAEDQKIYTGD